MIMTGNRYGNFKCNMNFLNDHINKGGWGLENFFLVLVKIRGIVNNLKVL